jgi:predicted phosphodiesterase
MAGVVAGAKRFRIQYVSDLHLELRNPIPAFETLLRPCAPYLALAGDIGHPTEIRSLFEWAAPRWKHIFYVAGNHEYYDFSNDPTHHENLVQRKRQLEQIADMFPNIHFFSGANRGFLCEEENVAIVGCTLWTAVDAAGTGWHLMNDYKRIRLMGKELIHPKHVSMIHANEKAQLAKEIEAWANRGASVCVITHHLPSFRLVHPRWTGHPANECFASNSDALIRAPVRLWIYGHTHSASHHVINGIPVVSNAYGYEGERVGGWSAEAWMEIPYVDPQEAEEAYKAGLGGACGGLMHRKRTCGGRESCEEEEIVLM